METLFESSLAFSVFATFIFMTTKKNNPIVLFFLGDIIKHAILISIGREPGFISVSSIFLCIPHTYTQKWKIYVHKYISNIYVMYT